jgi:hypothetical protein
MVKSLGEMDGNDIFSSRWEAELITTTLGVLPMYKKSTTMAKVEEEL